VDGRQGVAQGGGVGREVGAGAAGVAGEAPAVLGVVQLLGDGREVVPDMVEVPSTHPYTSGTSWTPASRSRRVITTSRFSPGSSLRKIFTSAAVPRKTFVFDC
jgi:hypothetical protein